MSKMMLSRHRLPEPFRSILVGLWLTPITLLTLTVIRFGDTTAALSHPMTLLVGMVMCLPALYVWNAGVDVTENALRIRVCGWRTRTFKQLSGWQLDQFSADAPILCIWDVNHERVLYTHIAHLSDHHRLTTTLRGRIPYRSRSQRV